MDTALIILGVWILCFAFVLFVTFLLDEKSRPEGFPCEIKGWKGIRDCFVSSPLVTFAVFLYALEKFFKDF